MSAAAPIAIVAAMEEELAPLRRRLGAASLRRRPLVVAASGVGHRRAGTAVGALLERHCPSLLIGVGLAGALSPGLAEGELLAPRRVRHPDGRWEAADELWQARAAVAGATTGIVCTQERIAASAAERSAAYAALASREPAAVDLESAAWLREAASRGVPAIVLRAISETTEEDLPAFVAACQRSDGSLSRTRVVLAALRSADGARALLRMRQRARFCAERLAVAVAMLVS